MGIFFDARIEVAIIALILVTLFSVLIWLVNYVQRKNRLKNCAKGNHEETTFYGRYYDTFTCECGKVDKIRHHNV